MAKTREQVTEEGRCGPESGVAYTVYVESQGQQTFTSLAEAEGFAEWARGEGFETEVYREGPHGED